MLAIRRTARCANIVQSSSQSIRIVLYECDTELELCVGRSRAGADVTRGKTLPRLANDHVASCRLGKSQGEDCEEDEDLWHHLANCKEEYSKDKTVTALSYYLQAQNNYTRPRLGQGLQLKSLHQYAENRL
jgi:hypothetical protein